MKLERSVQTILLVGWAVMVAGLALFTVAISRDALTRRLTSTALANGKSTLGEVTRSDQHGNRTGALHLVARFRVDGNEVLADNKRGNPEGLSDRNALERYPVGSSIEVYYDPEDPSVAAFTREITWRGRALAAMGLVFATLLVALAPWIRRRLS